jgi:hypothetical protein
MAENHACQIWFPESIGYGSRNQSAQLWRDYAALLATEDHFERTVFVSPLGRPPKTEDARFVFKTIRFPPNLWAELERVAPPHGRSAIVQEGLRRELARLSRRARANANGPVTGDSSEGAEAL